MRGDLFGEISLFSGQPSGVTILASEDLEVMLIVLAMAQSLVERKPSLARELGVTIETRTRLIEAARSGTAAAAGIDKPAILEQLTSSAHGPPA